MKIALVLTDSSADCRKALESLSRYGDLFSAEVEVFIVMEDLYRLESASVSMGVPLPPDTVSKAKESILNRVKSLWRKIKEDERATLEIKTVAGFLQEELPKLIEENEPDMLLWGCQPISSLCRVIEELDIPTLIIK